MYNIQRDVCDNDIPFEVKGVAIRTNRMSGQVDYLLYVPTEQFPHTIRLLKQYFGIVTESSDGFTGECPGCGTNLVSNVKCPECGLALIANFAGSFKEHPFYIFLENNSLL